MPNWVRNNVVITGSHNKLNKFVDKHFNKKGEFDFETVIPMPDKIFKGDLGKEEERIYGSNNWYDWSIKNWGTKWNANTVASPTISKVAGKNSRLEFCFDTAWSFPEGVYQELATMYSDLRIDVEFADEDIGNNCGIISISGGDYSVEDVETRAFAMSVWGYDEDEDMFA